MLCCGMLHHGTLYVAVGCTDDININMTSADSSGASGRKRRITRAMESSVPRPGGLKLLSCTKPGLQHMP